MRNERLDGKYYGTLRKLLDGATLPDDWVVFRAKDDAFAAILPLYRDKCVEVGSPQEQVTEIDKLIDRVSEWRKANADKCRAPD